MQAVQSGYQRRPGILQLSGQGREFTVTPVQRRQRLAIVGMLFDGKRNAAVRSAPVGAPGASQVARKFSPSPKPVSTMVNTRARARQADAGVIPAAPWPGPDSALVIPSPDGRGTAFLQRRTRVLPGLGACARTRGVGFKRHKARDRRGYRHLPIAVYDIATVKKGKPRLKLLATKGAPAFRPTRQSPDWPRPGCPHWR